MSWGLRLFMAVSGFVLLWASAHMKYYVGPVPISGQLLVVLACGFVMEWPVAMLTVAAYAVAAFADSPLFAADNPALTGGYLIGFVLAAGLMAKAWPRLVQTESPPRFSTAFILALAGTAIVHALGFAWLHTALAIVHADQTVAMTLMVGTVPFIVPDLVKCAIAAFAATYRTR